MEFVNDVSFLITENNKKPITPPPPLISGWVEGRRVMPPDTPFPGPWQNARSPYGVEIADNLSPFIPVQTTSVLKGAQLGLTAWAENVVGYWMDPNPSQVLYASATDDLLEKWSSGRLEPLIDSIGMRHKIHAHKDPQRTRSRSTGDTTMRKMYVGGALSMASAQSPGSLRSESKRVLILDEIDGAPRMLRTGEGNWLDVVYARASGWGARKKILEFSTPTTEEESLIWERFKMGDQRRYAVPCPHCGTFIFLEFKHLRWEMKDGQLHRVWYKCQECDGIIFNHNKTDMLVAGEWRPTAVAQKKGHRSYYIPSLYSPCGMLSWYELVEKYLDAKQTPDGMRSWVTLYLGLPFKQRGSRPKVEVVRELKGDYLDGKEVPSGVLFVTAGIDVQQGSGWNYEKNCANDPENPPRLEIEVLGHGSDFRTWSILYKVIPGPVMGSAFDGAWEDMHQWACNGGLSFSRRDGMQFQVDLVFIDSGDGNNVDIVYTFCSRWQNTYACKGANILKKKKEEKGDEAGPANFRRYQVSKSDRMGGVTFYTVATNYYKNHIYTNLKIPRRDSEPQAPGFCTFPRDRDDRYFIQLTAEEKRIDGSFHAYGRRNEALDCRVYSLCAGDVYLDAKVSAARAAAKTAGVKDIELQQITHRTVLDYMTKQRAWRMVA